MISILSVRKLFLLLCLCIMLCLPGISQATDIKDITSTDLKRLIQSNNDKVVAVTFWATWCKVCQEHIPELSALYEKYRGKNVEVIGISLDDKRKVVEDFVDRKEIAFPMFKAKDKEEMSYVYDIKKIPLIYYYKNGEFKHKEEGYTEPKHIEEDLRSCLEGSQPPSK